MRMNNKIPPDVNYSEFPDILAKEPVHRGFHKERMWDGENGTCYVEFAGSFYHEEEISNELDVGMANPAARNLSRFRMSLTIFEGTARVISLKWAFFFLAPGAGTDPHRFPLREPRRYEPQNGGPGDQKNLARTTINRKARLSPGESSWNCRGTSNSARSQGVVRVGTWRTTNGPGRRPSA